MKVKKISNVCIIVIILLFYIGGCSNKNMIMNDTNTNHEIVKITFFGNKYEPENVKVIEEIISDFMNENPTIRVSYESLKGNKYFEALEKRMEAGKGDDVIMVNHDIVLTLEAKGQLADLSKLTSVSNYTDQMLYQMKKEEKIYWLPTTVSAFGLYCNLNLLAEHKQEVPKNLKEWESICSYFAEQGIVPIIANNDISIKTLAIGTSFYSIYQQNQQDEVFERLNQGKEKLSTYLFDGFSLAQGFIKKGYIEAKKALQTKKTSDDLQEFIKGESPFMLTGAWAAGRVKNMQPDFKFEVVPYPALEDDSFLVINADTRLSINADSKHLDEAMKFVEYFTQPENIQKFADEQSSFSPLKGGSPSHIEEIQPLISCYQSKRAVIGADGLLDIPIWDLTAQASQKLLLKEDIKTVMEWMDRQVIEQNIKQGETQ